MEAARSVSLPGEAGSTTGSTSRCRTAGSNSGSGSRARSRCGGRRCNVRVRVEASYTVAQSSLDSGSLQSGA